MSSPPRTSVRAEILHATQLLTEAGIVSARVDAELLAAHLLDVPRMRLGLHPLAEFGWAEQYRAVVRQRAARIPLQHLTGSADLAGTTVLVGPGVFIPRPETESLVAWAVQALSGTERPVVVDLCTGSGAIALAVAAARPDAIVHAVERAPAALGWARRNAERQARAGGTPLRLRGGDVLDPRVLADLDGAADLVTANPPYVPAGATLDPEVREHDPLDAVVAGADGLDVIRPLVSVIAGLLREGGVLAMEHDDTHGETVPALFSARRVFAEVQDHADLAGRPRFVTARRVRIDRTPRERAARRRSGSGASPARPTRRSMPLGLPDSST